MSIRLKKSKIIRNNSLQSIARKNYLSKKYCNFSFDALQNKQFYKLFIIFFMLRLELDRAEMGMIEGAETLLNKLLSKGDSPDNLWNK
jgi:hypothetical protein